MKALTIIAAWLAFALAGCHRGQSAAGGSRATNGGSAAHRASTLLADEWNGKEARPVTHRCCKPAPAVVEFDAAGNYLRGWDAPPAGSKLDWPKSEHGIYIDPEGNVWIAGNADEDN